MKPASLSRFDVEGAAGRIEVKVNDPGDTRQRARRGIALLAHPHPLFGGSNENKVVTTLARVLFDAGYLVARPNFRGVGDSAGVHDEGRGETDDLERVLERLQAHHGQLPVVLAGFSFGGFVASRLAARRAEAGEALSLLVLVAPAVSRFAVGEVGPSTVVIHGEDDDVVTLGQVLDWARPQSLPISLVPGTGHFFHGKLPVLARLMRRALSSAAVE